MEFFDYSQIDEAELDRLFDEADPCECCYSKYYLALAVLTDPEHHGVLIMFCAKCDVNKEDTDFSVEDESITKYI